MDPLVLLIPLLALAIGLVAILKLPRSLLGGPKPVTPELETRLQELELEVGALRHELDDAHERLDFAERLLARGEEARALPKN